MRQSTFRAFAVGILMALAGSWPAWADPLKLPFPVGPNQGLFLHISDIHFDPFEDQSLFTLLVNSDVDQWEGIFAKASDGHFESSDSNFALLMSALEQAKGAQYDFIVNTGDELVHDFLPTFYGLAPQGDAHAFVVKTLQFVDLMLKKTFPGVPIVATLGNNDSDCDDYGVTPNGPMLKDYGEDLPVVDGNKEALEDFKIGGYYLVPHPTVPKHDFIVLDSVFWSKDYKTPKCAAGTDPAAAEFLWLKKVLDEERGAKRKASFVMHIPPGIDADGSRTAACPSRSDPHPGKTMWGPPGTEDYADEFLKLTTGYKDVLRDAYAGHTHMDEFRVVSDRNGNPFLTVQITPAISPRFGNNPAFTVMLYDRTDAAVNDSATFYLTNLSSAGPKTPGDWKLEYAFAKAYGVNAYTPANMQTLAKSIRAGGAERVNYMTFFAAKGPTHHMTKANFMAYSCAQTAMTLGAYNACRCPTSLQPVAIPPSRQ